MKRFRLSKSSLLRKTKEFDLVYRTGRRLRGSGFMLIYLRSGRTCSRLGISVPRKAGNAAHRSRIKRIVRETFRLHQELFPQSSDIVFAVRPGFPLRGMHAVRTAVAGLPAMREQC